MLRFMITYVPSLKLTACKLPPENRPQTQKETRKYSNHPFPSPLSYLIPESTCNASNRLSHWKKKHLPTGPPTVRAGWISPSFLGGFKTSALEKHREPKQQCALSRSQYCWWFRNPASTSWLVVLSRYLQGLYLPGGARFLPSTVVFVGVEILQWNWWVFFGWGKVSTLPLTPQASKTGGKTWQICVEQILGPTKDVHTHKKTIGPGTPNNQFFMVVSNGWFQIIT